MIATESAYAGQIADKLLDTVPDTVSKLRPSHTFTYKMDSDDMEIFAEHPKIVEKIYQRAVSMACERYWSRYKVRHVEGEQMKQQEIFRHNNLNLNIGLRAFDRLKIQLEFYSTTTMRQISPKIEGKPIVFDCRIMAVGAKNGYIKHITADDDGVSTPHLPTDRFKHADTRCDLAPSVALLSEEQ